MKRLICFLFIALLILGCFTGCGDDNASKDNSQNPTGQLTAVDVQYIAADGSSVYRIIRPNNVSEMSSIAVNIVKHFKNGLGVSIRNTTDAESENDSYEILLGETNRKETLEAKKYLESKTGARFNDIIICTIGKKIVIYSENIENMTTACDYFLNNYVKKEGFKSGFEYIKNADGSFKSVTINGVEAGKFDFVRPHYNSSYLTEVAMQETQAKILADTGYKMNITHDTYTADKPLEYEVIVGNTTRDGVEKLADSDDYKITVKGKKVYINGGSAHATALAVKEFGKMLEKGKTDASSVVSTYTETIRNYDTSKEYSYAWGDDFSGDTIDLTKWDLKDRHYSANPGANDKWSIRSDDPNDVYVSDGKLHICARQDDKFYYGGMLRTEGIMNYKYGIIEMSAIIPEGDGFWIALWAMSDDANSVISPNEPMISFPEIDIVECYGNSTRYFATAHAWVTDYGKTNYPDFDHLNPNGNYGTPDGVKLGEGFHTYGSVWDDKQISFFCDGEIFTTVEYGDDPQKNEAYNHSMYLILSLATGFKDAPLPNPTENPDEWQNTNKFIVDWLNIYQKNDGKHELIFK